MTAAQRSQAREPRQSDQATCVAHTLYKSAVDRGAAVHSDVLRFCSIWSVVWIALLSIS
jgi:hypothetical protein